MLSPDLTLYLAAWILLVVIPGVAYGWYVNHLGAARKTRLPGRAAEFLGALLLACLAALVIAWDDHEQVEHRGQVVKIADGDTLTILADGKPLVVRLAYIDTPEWDQPFGAQAKAALSALAFGKQARVVEVDIDRLWRIVGRVYVGDSDVSALMVRGGYAWVYRRYNRDPRLLPLEAEAKRKRRGLWADRDPVPPWEWRMGRRR